MPTKGAGLFNKIRVSADEVWPFCRPGGAREGHSRRRVQLADHAFSMATVARLAAIVLDVRRRNDAGWEECRQPRTDSATRGIPIVVCCVGDGGARRSFGREGWMRCFTRADV